MHILSSKLNFADIPYEVEKNLENALKEDDNWKCAASFIQDWFAEDPVLSSADIREMELKGSPARDLMNKFIQLYFTVEDVQFVLTKSGLTKIANLLVTNVPVNFGYPKEDQEVAVQLGHPYEMEIRLFGSPYPDLQWYRNNVPLPGKNENKLLLTQVCKEDAGVYQCKAVQNIQGKLEEFWSQSISLQTKRSKPTVALGKDLKDMTLEANKDLFLKYEVLAEPEPVYTWYKNGKEIQKSSSCIFKIYGVGVADAGLYFCEAENTEGICRSAESTVTVSQPCTAPDIPVIVRQPEVRSSYALRDTADLYFEVRCRHAVQFLCYINGRSLNDIKRVGTTAVSDKVGDYTHVFNLHYEVNKEDWCHGNQGPIVVCIEAHSQGFCVPSSAIIEVKGTPLNNQQLTARNKWALLIANNEYSSEHVLKTPAQDMKAFSSALTSLGFRCMTCCNVTKSEFMAILSLFLSYCQNGDYVAFYYAGHGFHHRGVDYILPLHFERKGMWGNEVEEQACITTTEVINRFQRSDPALIFYVHDTCRVTRIAKDFQEQETHRDAKGNLCLLNATSENYNTYEEPDSGSLLMQELKSLISRKIPVTALCDRVLKAFRNHMNDGDGNGPQVPQCVCDLQYDFSLTDPAAPLQQDYHTVLNKWEEMSNVGGTKEEVVKVGNNVMEVKIKCEQDGYPMIISNSIDVVVRITFKNSRETTGEEGLVVTVTPNTSDTEVIEEVTDNPIRCTVENLQALDNDLCVAVTFTKEENIVAECRFNLGTPSICNIMNNIRNEL